MKSITPVAVLCAALGISPVCAEDAPVAAPDAAPPDVAVQPQPPVAGSEPPQELSADLVYSVLVGEVAAQRADQRMAFTHYLHAARLAQEPELAALAARAALALGDADAGQRAVSLWQELAPESVKARQIAAYVQIEAADRAGTLAALRELVRLTPPVKQPYMQAAQLLARVEEPAERLALMQELIAGVADDADAQFALATLAAAADNNDLAREAAEKAAALRPEWNDPRVFIVQLLVADGHRDAAAEALDAYLSDNADDRELRLLRAQLHVDAEEYESALAVFDELLRDEPGQPEVLFTAAVLALEVDELDQARGYLTALREQGRREDDVAFLLGQVEERAGNRDAALGWYAQVDGPNATDAAVRIARLHAESGDVSRARDMLQQLRDQMPEESVTLS